MQNLSSIPHSSDLCFCNNGFGNVEKGGWDKILLMSEKVSVKYLFVTLFLKFLYIPRFVDFIILY